MGITIFIYPLLDKRTHFIWLLHFVILGALIIIFIGPLITQRLYRDQLRSNSHSRQHTDTYWSRGFLSVEWWLYVCFTIIGGLVHSALTGHCALHEPDAIMNSNKFYINGTFFHFYNKYCPVFNNSLSGDHLRNVYVTKNVSLDLL